MGTSVIQKYATMPAVSVYRLYFEFVCRRFHLLVLFSVFRSYPKSCMFYADMPAVFRVTETFI